MSGAAEPAKHLSQQAFEHQLFVIKVINDIIFVTYSPPVVVTKSLNKKAWGVLVHFNFTFSLF